MTRRPFKEHRYTVSAGVLPQILRYLSSRNVNIDEFMKSVALESSLLRNPDGRISVERYVIIEETASKVTNDPCFGLHMGQFAEAGNWSILGYMMMNCRTVLEAFHKFSRYSSVIGNLIKGEIIIGHDAVMIKLSEPINAPKISKHCYEGYFSSLISLARNVSGQIICPTEVALASFKPEWIEEYIGVFGSGVRFSHNGNYMVMDIRSVNTPVLLPNENLLRYFESFAKEFLEEIEGVNSFTYRTKKLILSLMDTESLSIKRIAEELSISCRTLQANLRDEGTEFSRLLRQTREQLAKKYLLENYSIEEITYLLGFSEPSVFRRAFKKWVGVTAKEYREREQNKISHT
ncbi:MAG: AraC family transcriptional regulator [Clostridia bacterium]|nr:AraC family transcriptional regulator [Clostridia bacterium]